METRVKFIKGAHVFYVAAQLLTRDDSEVNFESGMVLLPEMDQAIVRHMANKVDYVYMAFPVNVSVDYDEWYTMRLMVCNGVMKAYVNDVQIYVSDSAFPVGEYGEPHLAVRYGITGFDRSIGIDR